MPTGMRAIFLLDEIVQHLAVGNGLLETGQRKINDPQDFLKEPGSFEAEELQFHAFKIETHEFFLKAFGLLVSHVFNRTSSR